MMAIWWEINIVLLYSNHPSAFIKLNPFKDFVKGKESKYTKCSVMLLL